MATHSYNQFLYHLLPQKHYQHLVFAFVFILPSYFKCVIANLKICHTRSNHIICDSYLINEE